MRWHVRVIKLMSVNEFDVPVNDMSALFVEDFPSFPGNIPWVPLDFQDLNKD